MNRIAAGAVAGLVLGLLIGGYLGGGLGAALVPTLLTAIAGAVIGFLAERVPSVAVVFLGGAVIGVLTYWFIGRQSAQTPSSLLLGAIVGLAIAAVVNFRGRRRAP